MPADPGSISILYSYIYFNKYSFYFLPSLFNKPNWNGRVMLQAKGQVFDGHLTARHIGHIDSLTTNSI